MLKGKEFGAAIAAAIKMKIDSGRVKSKAEIARHFNIKPPSLVDWVKKGSISKDRLPELWRYFSDVAGPAHWGFSASEWPAGLSSAEQPSPNFSVSEGASSSLNYSQRIELASMRHGVPIVSMDSVMDGTPMKIRGGRRVAVADGVPGDFLVEAEDDSLANGRNMSIRRGALMLIDPGADLVSGKTYLVAFSGGGRPVPREVEITGPLISLRTSPDAPVLPMPEGARIVGRVRQVVQVDA